MGNKEISGDILKKEDVRVLLSHIFCFEIRKKLQVLLTIVKFHIDNPFLNSGGIIMVQINGT
jgi:hypothetical protein